MSEFAINTEYPVVIKSDDLQLHGLLYVPHLVSGVVIFAHGSGSSRFSSRNQYVAKQLQKSKLATLLFDLLTPEEEAIDAATAELRFDIELLASRLIAATQWVMHNPILNQLPIGYFGASTGGAAALVAAARFVPIIKAVVSRGGRPDLAGESLLHVEAPTLLIVGGNDEVVIELNEEAFNKLHCKKELTIIDGATHLFEEPGKLEEVARLASGWFANYIK